MITALEMIHDTEARTLSLKQLLLSGILINISWFCRFRNEVFLVGNTNQLPGGRKPVYKYAVAFRYKKGAK